MQEVVALGITIADVLEVLHDAGILHRDIKPSNVGYDTAGTPKLLDFGLAKILGDSRLTSASGPGRYEDLEDVPVAALTELTATRRVVGTPIYLSPEAASGEPADALFDLWALAVVLFEAAAGAHPLLSQGTAGLRKRIFEGDVADIRTLIPDCGPAPANFFDRALARDRAARPQTAAEFRERLQETRSRL